MAGELTREDFEAYVGRMVHLTGADLGLRLAHIEGGGDAPADHGARFPFTLIFRAPKSARVAPEGLYTCVIEDGPSHDLYIAPIHTPNPANQDYQAVFN